jgi:hypothetical protein
VRGPTEPAGKHVPLWSHQWAALRCQIHSSSPDGSTLETAYFPSDTSSIGSFSSSLEFYFESSHGVDEICMRRPSNRWPSNCFHHTDGDPCWDYRRAAVERIHAAGSDLLLTMAARRERRSPKATGQVSPREGSSMCLKVTTDDAQIASIPGTDCHAGAFRARTR